MSEIKIISVEIENFRQYYGNSKIDFISRDEGFTVIFGYNGEGKSNFLNVRNLEINLKKNTANDYIAGNKGFGQYIETFSGDCEQS